MDDRFEMAFQVADSNPGIRRNRSPSYGLGERWIEQFTAGMDPPVGQYFFEIFSYV